MIILTIFGGYNNMANHRHGITFGDLHIIDKLVGLSPKRERGWKINTTSLGTCVGVLQQKMPLKQLTEHSHIHALIFQHKQLTHTPIDTVDHRIQSLRLTSD
jgi:hypothetical protein